MRGPYIKILRLSSILLLTTFLVGFHYLIQLIITNRLHPSYLIWLFPIFIYIFGTAFGFGTSIIAGITLCVITLYIVLITTEHTLLWGVIFIITQLLFMQWTLRKCKKENTKTKLQREELKETLIQVELEYKRELEYQKIEQKKLDRYLRLQNIAESFVFTLSFDEICKRLMEHVIENVPHGSRYSLWELTEDLKTVRLRLVRDLELNGTVDFMQDDDFNKWILRHRYPLMIEDISSDFRFDSDKITASSPIKSLIAVPMMTRDHIMGILRVESFTPKKFTMDDLRILAIIGNIGTLTAYNAKLFKQTEYLATHDSLTGLYVKRILTERLEELSQKVTKQQLSHIAILMLDLDFFKDVNDTYGHIIGDRILKEVADVIKEVITVNGSCYRYGGEEFAILLPRHTKEEAFVLGNKIRQRIENKIFYVRRKDIKITISVGVSAYPEDAENIEEVFKMADNALYTAKKLGRNRTVTWSSER